MALFKKIFQVKPNTVGYLYKDNVFQMTLSAGVYDYWDFSNRLELFTLSSASKLLNVLNQEVLTKDNIAFRFSFSLVYRIVDGIIFLSKFPLDRESQFIVAEAEQRIWNMAQLFIKNIISTYNSEELNDKREALTQLDRSGLNKKLVVYGVEIEELEIKDLTFPKFIQDLFAKQLEAKIWSNADLENARTAVATARTLKNAADLMKDDQNIRFFQLIETVTKIAEKGKHTFVIGDMNQIGSLRSQ